MSETPNPMRDHEYDGISELDNKLPRWWVWLFNLTIGFSVVYWLFFHVLHLGPLQDAKWENEMAAARGVPAEATTGPDTAVAAATEEPSTDAAVLARGREVFTANCAVCHGQNGEGLIGPNMTDEYWIHGATYADSVRIIREGVIAKGMIAWKAVLRPADIQAVGSYMYSLRGTSPANAKAPEGVKAEAATPPSA